MEYPTYLIHYGIPGQKWGNRRWQYEDGSLTPEGYIHYGYGKSGKQRKEYLESRERIRSGKATANDIAQLNGNKYIIDLDAMYVTYGYKYSGENSALGSLKISELEKQGRIETLIDGKDKGMDMIQPAMALKKNQPLNLDDELIMKSVTRRINPNYGERGTTNNCVRCTTAMTLAKMGYSTPQGISAGRAFHGAASAGFSYWFDGAEMKTVNSTEDAENELKSQPKGSFGEFAISRFDANGNRIGGHSMAYSVLSDGSVRIEEGQAGQVFHSIKDAMENCGASDKQIMITRLDNTKPNFEAIADDGMIDIGGSRTNDNVYMIKDKGSFSWRNSDRRVTDFNFERSGIMTNYSTAGRRSNDTLGGSDTTNIKFDDDGYMYYNGSNGMSKVSSNEQSMIRSLESSGKTQEEIARLLGLSVSTISKYS